MLANVKIGTTDNRARLFVNGTDISNICRGYKIEQVAGNICEVTLDMLAYVEFEGEANVIIEKDEEDGYG